MIIGLTGGIGSGKSTVAKIFAQLNIAVYDADAESKKLIDTDHTLQKALVDLLGAGIVKEGKINRPVMARKIFDNQALLHEVNALIHPAVARHFVHWYKQQGGPYVLREAAILYESGSFKDCDRVITVFAPEEVRVKRVMERNGITEEEVRARMAHQWPETEKLKRADYVIYNDGTQSLIKQVLRIHEDIKRQANKTS